MTIEGFPINTLAAAAAVPNGWRLARRERSETDYVSDRFPAQPGDWITEAVLPAAAIREHFTDGTPWWPEALNDPLPEFADGARVTVAYNRVDNRRHGVVVSTLANGDVMVGAWDIRTGCVAPDGTLGRFDFTEQVHPAWLTEGWDESILSSGLTVEQEAAIREREAQAAKLRDLPREG